MTVLAHKPLIPKDISCPLAKSSVSTRQHFAAFRAPTFPPAPPPSPPGGSHVAQPSRRRTTPATVEGLERSRRARWKGGRYSEKRKEWRRQFRAFIRRSRAELRAIRCELKALVDATQFGPGAEAIPPARRVSIPEATLKRAPLASVRHAAIYRVHPRFSHSCTSGPRHLTSTL